MRSASAAPWRHWSLRTIHDDGLAESAGGAAIVLGMTRLVLVIVLLAAVPVAAQDRIVLGGPMRFSSGDIAFRGWFVGAAADVWRVEPFGYLSEDADVWAIVTGAGVPVWRGPLGRLSLRLGTEIVLHGPAVEPGVHRLIGVGGRIGQRYGAVASIDRAPEFTLMRAGFFVGW